jgi:hypothetical protein
LCPPKLCVPEETANTRKKAAVGEMTPGNVLILLLLALVRVQVNEYVILVSPYFILTNVRKNILKDTKMKSKTSNAGNQELQKKIVSQITVPIFMFGPVTNVERTKSANKKIKGEE